MSAERLDCDTHGKAYSTFIREHLAANPVQRWHCDYPTEDVLWPDAWCSKCEAEYLKEGEWNETNKSVGSITSLCHNCYLDAKARSVDYLQGRELELWESFVVDCYEKMIQKQELMNKKFSFGKHETWHVDLKSGELVFSNSGVPAVIANVELVGSVSNRSKTWLWSWANFSSRESLCQRIKAVREYGESKGFPCLIIPQWRAEEIDGWKMSGVAAHVLDAPGVYRAPVAIEQWTGSSFLLITKIWWEQ